MLHEEPKAIFLSWTGFHGRSEGLARAIGIPSFFVAGGRGPALVRYVRQWRRTWRILREEVPEAIVLMLPPFPALLAVMLYVSRCRASLAGDLHTGVFDDPKWTWATRFTLGILRRAGVAIVTNESLAERVRSRGGRVLVVDDLIEVYSDTAMPDFEDHKLDRLESIRYVLVPLAYAHDEPIDALLAAARALPLVSFVFTGVAPSRVVKRAPVNVAFPGYVSDANYRGLLARAAVVVAPTLNEDTMQRAGYEALCAGKALVTTETRVLVEYFGEAAVIARPEAASLERSISFALDSQADLERKMIELRARKIEAQSAAIRALEQWLRMGAAQTGRGNGIVADRGMW